MDEGQKWAVTIAAEALLDPEYAQGMIDYDEAYQSLADEIWEQHYLQSEEIDRVKA